ncbi:MAG: cysteine--tRNA ligase, partial [Clostridia bacterium]
ECTAMSRKFLGDLFDIHTGGVDHIPIHHENEIAQAESLLGHKAVNYWMHSEFMLIDGGKMSKSLGNDYTVQNLIDRGYAPIEFRYFCLNVHYRQKINFTFEGMDSAKTAYARLCEQLYAHKVSNVKTSEETLSKYKEEFLSSFNDDLSVPTALGVLWKMIKEPKSVDIYNLAVEMDSVFGLNLDKIAPPREDGEVPQEVITIVEERLLARQNKEWKKSDELRAQILALGYIVKDTAEGYSLSKVN